MKMKEKNHIDNFLHKITYNLTQICIIAGYERFDLVEFVFFPVRCASDVSIMVAE